MFSFVTGLHKPHYKSEHSGICSRATAAAAAAAAEGTLCPRTGFNVGGVCLRAPTEHPDLIIIRAKTLVLDECNGYAIMV